MARQHKRIGRPRKAPKPGTRVSLGLKVTSDIKNKLDRAAQASGRTQSQEAELRIERSFDRENLLVEALNLAYGRQGAGAVLLIAEAMHNAGAGAALIKTGTVEESQNWLDVPYAYDQASKAVAKILDELRPAGDSTPPDDERLLKPNIGEGIAEAFLAEAASGQTKLEHRRDRATQIHELLGSSVVNRLTQSARRDKAR
jgi:hypothetical protein